MSSVGAVSTAADSRSDKDERCNEDYRTVMPPIPTGEYLLNFVFLHADIGARPYRIEGFQAGLESAGVLREIAACGSFQLNHVWLVTLKSAAAEEKLAAVKAFEVKGRRCVIIDPDRAEVRLKLHWIPFYMPDDCVKKALEPYGKVEGVPRETWHVGGFEGVQSTTRTVRLTHPVGERHRRAPASSAPPIWLLGAGSSTRASATLPSLPQDRAHSKGMSRASL
ncbi:unnamed protein product [Ixodes pacificus]